MELQRENSDLKRASSELKKENMELRSRCEIITNEFANSKKDFQAIMAKHDIVGDDPECPIKKSTIQIELENTVMNLQKDVEKEKKEKQIACAKYYGMQTDLMKTVSKNKELIKENTILKKKCEELTRQLNKVLEAKPMGNRSLNITTNISSISLHHAPLDFMSPSKDDAFDFQDFEIQKQNSNLQEKHGSPFLQEEPTHFDINLEPMEPTNLQGRVKPENEYPKDNNNFFSYNAKMADEKDEAKLFNRSICLIRDLQLIL